MITWPRAGPWRGRPTPGRTDHQASTFTVRREPLLGTVVEIVVTERSQRRATRIGAAVLSEVERLESVFSTYRADSELSRWKREDQPAPSSEFCAVMATALDWQERSGGSFNPLTGVLTSIWLDAEHTGAVPSADQLADAAGSIRRPRFEMHGGVPVAIDSCDDLNLNAIAKGYIVDKAIATAIERFDPLGILVSAGGDLAQRGAGASHVGIENPLRPYDNEPPLVSVRLHNAGLATSGGSRRGFRVGGQRFSHVIDPRTGRPVDQQASISVIATSAMTADVLATVAGVMSPAEAVAYIDATVGAGCLVVDPHGRQWSDPTWNAMTRGEGAPAATGDTDPR